jgi:hypothetical protein
MIENSEKQDNSETPQKNDIKMAIESSAGELQNVANEVDLEKEYKKIDCSNENYYSSECNKFLLKKELVEREYLSEHSEENPYLYPNLNDVKFNIKIASKKEFNDTKYDGVVYANIKEQADILAKADFELQPHQAFVKNFMSFQTPYSSLMLYHGLGTGKCHAKGTPIIMSDGTVKLIENIKEGELLMGDDSRPRTVLSLARGRDKMYNIIPVKGEKYTVNQEHILCLRASENCEGVNNYITNDNIIEISVKDYLELPEETKALLKGYKVPVDFPEKEVPMDPYLIGNTLTDNIPLLYKCNSRVNRLKLLAGLLDTNGKVNQKGTCFEFIQKNESLLDDVIFLARSLGFDCYKTKNNSDIINISGNDLTEIPVKHIMSNLAPQRQSLGPFPTNGASLNVDKDVLVTGIKVEYLKEDDYYGFTLDGNCRYLMGDFTVTHNTCSAIGVCEEMRDYMKQMGITKRIIIVASENVQDNFKLQLFDERKLTLVDGLWNIRSCTGNKLLKEINPMSMKGMPKEKVVSQIKNIINTYYIFLGYVQFANYIIKTMNYDEEVQKQGFKKNFDNKKGDKTKGDKTKEKQKTKIQMLKDVKIELNSRIIKRLQNEFDNRLIVIDEVHNIRKTDDNENKKVAINLELLVKSAKNMRFLLLSATPMYNTYKEIVWLLNLMNTNDRRGRIEAKDIFDKNGDFKKSGEELLIRKATGYISFVRGENPYTFPYRVYPSEFAKEDTFPFIKYPSYQMNLKKIKHEDQKRVLSLYLTKIGGCNNCGACQYCAYKYIIYNLRNKKFSITTKTGQIRDMPSFENMESFGYTLLQIPLESLIISYPVQGLKEVLDDIPEENLLEDFSPSFSESISNDIANEDDIINENDISLLDEASSETEETADKDNIRILGGSSGYHSSSSIKGRPSVDPHQLTGKIGLERMMNFVDEKSPPVKGDFEYKKTTLDKYGKIFSRDLIGKYSAKIKCILDQIMNPETGTVSEGVILIYSQYIDSGLIPMALALEEMGFTRYGQGEKPLFKDKPTEVVDVRTMKKPEDKKNFMPARYAMITGETRLSPNNDFEVKGVTDDENIFGNKVKVVLISKAGSEGIDFKFIRQIHILEPWYNMNRIEQIIGRGVRNFSHKDLPFEKRNVEIFMYGTILDNNIEEAADLYVYRVAEYKAVQIGKVTRVLKESAVDCIINHDQTNFTQEIMGASLKEPIIQELSNGVVLNEFKVGDAPFSPACDYMAKCNYDCRPNKEIDENNLNEDTYNENFILMNSEKILQRIRMLMRESFFYKKDVLLRSIRTPKEYPLVQIYSALTQLIEDENEFIMDKYGRNGRLVNIGDYYLFQPIELKDKNASIFERSVPIDYKHDMINFEIKKNMVNPIVDKKNLNKALIEEEGIRFPEGKRLLDEMQVNFDISRDFSKQPKVPRGDDNWYKHCGIVMKKMAKEYPESKNDNLLIKFLVAHMIEVLLFDDKLAVMNYLYSLDSIKQGTLEWFAKEYFETHSITTRNFIVFIMYKLNKRMIMILNEKNIWVEAEPEDQREIASSKEAREFLTMQSNEYNKIIGFIGYEKNNHYLIFKTKDMTSKRDTGARCDEAGKTKTIQKINEIVGETKYTNENTKVQKDVDGNVVSEAVGQTELCVFQEFILRYFNAIKKDDKRWFLTPEMALWYKIYTVFV